MAHDHQHGHGEGHSHTHGAVDPSLATSERGIWAVKWSFVGLFATALLQLTVVVMSGSVALLSDTIHNFGDALTAVPLWVAFTLTRLGTSQRFTFGYGRAEDLAGVLVVLTILFSAVVAGYQAIERLINPQPVGFLGAVAAAALVGFVGNEAVAVFRIRVGRQIGSAALVADGYHARTDGWTSLAVLLGAIGVDRLPSGRPYRGLAHRGGHPRDRMALGQDHFHPPSGRGGSEGDRRDPTRGKPSRRRGRSGGGQGTMGRTPATGGGKRGD
jgi:Co/Zn/Cd efflux system component